MAALGRKNHAYRHGMSTTPTYRVWASMIQRCRSSTSTGYENYGGRGIKVCSRWMSFKNFYADMGRRPRGRSLDRRDNDGDYCKDNCRWATRTEQNRNSRHNVHLTINGRTMLQTDWAKEAGLNPATLLMRVKAGWEEHQLLSPPSALPRERRQPPTKVA